MDRTAEDLIKVISDLEKTVTNAAAGRINMLNSEF